MPSGIPSVFLLSRIAANAACRLPLYAILRTTKGVSNFNPTTAALRTGNTASISGRRDVMLTGQGFDGVIGGCVSLQHVAEVGACKLGPHGEGGREGAVDKPAEGLHARLIESNPHPHLAAELPAHIM